MSAPTDPVLTPVKMAHVVLRTAKFGPMVAFWRTVLGARIVSEHPGFVLLSYDSEHHRIAIIHYPHAKTAGFAYSGLDHVAFTFGSLHELLAAYQQRKARGILPSWSVHHGTTISMYYVDPDGNKIETQVECFDTMEEGIAYTSTPEFIENPIGVDFDPEDLVRRLAAGESEAEIKKRPNAGPRGLDSVPDLKVPIGKESYDLIEATA